MKIANQRIASVRLLAVAIVVSALHGCGQRGPLVLPDREPAAVENPQSEDAADDEADRER